MDAVINFIFENSTVIILVSIPMAFIIIRDILVSRMQKRDLEMQKERVIASERCLEEIFNKIKANRTILDKQMNDLDNKIKDALDNNEQ